MEDASKIAALQRRVLELEKLLVQMQQTLEELQAEMRERFGSEAA